MAQFQSPGNIPGQYFTVAASQTSQAIGNVGAKGDYMESIIVIPASTTPGIITVKDGTTTVFATVAGTATVLPGVFTIPLKSYSKTGAWTITTGANVSLVCVGQFT